MVHIFLQPLIPDTGKWLLREVQRVTRVPGSWVNSAAVVSEAYIERGLHSLFSLGLESKQLARIERGVKDSGDGSMVPQKGGSLHLDIGVHKKAVCQPDHKCLAQTDSEALLGNSTVSEHSLQC